jgi:arabinofuranosyltransferase
MSRAVNSGKNCRMEASQLSTDRARSIAIWIGAAVILAWNIYSLRLFIEDDTYISLRYVINFARHGQLTWNLGERVEGYTNFLQIVATAPLVKCGVDPMVAVRCVNGLAVIGLLAAVANAARGFLTANPLAVPVGVFLIAASAPVILWMWGGLESGITAAFIAAAIAALLPIFAGSPRSLARALVGGLFFGLAYLSRPDSLAPAGAAVLAVFLLMPAPLMTRFRTAFLLGGVIAVIVAIHVAWRLSYYGDVLPNTFYAKMAGPLSERLAFGAPYVLKSMLSLPVIPLALIGLAITLALRKTTRAILMLGAVVCIQLLAVLWVGGDHMYGARMLVPIVGVACALLVAVLAVPMAVQWRRVALVAILVLTAGVNMAFPRYRMDSAAFGGTLVGQYINKAWPAGSVVALATAGSTPYFAPGFTYVDTLGLNDRTIAHRPAVPMRTAKQALPGHAKGDGAYVLRRQPDFIIFGPAWGALASRPVFLTDIELAATPEFHRCYVPEILRLPYSDAFAAQDWLYHPQPLPFIYYRRICAVSR